jgi:pimeloyl-ACP methyl ester carboxylesterase
MPRAPFQTSWLHYDLHGDGPPVILVMGLGAGRAAWDGQVQRLAADHRLMVFDNPGMGDSGPIEGRLSIRSMAKGVFALMDHVGWESAHVVGISMGGMIAQEAALLDRERVRSLSLLTTHAGSRGPGPLPTSRGLLLFVRQRLASLRGDERRRVELLLQLLFPPDFLAGPAGAQIRSGIGGVFGGKMQLATLNAQTMAVTRHAARHRLHELEGLPTLVVRSVDDLLVHPRAQARLHAAIPGARLVNLKGAGHGALAQFPDAIAQAVRAHIAAA